MVEGAARLKREIGYNPTSFNQMVAEHGGPEAARQLLNGRNASDRFTKLWDAQRLDMSVEAVALLPWYDSLFTDEQRAVARHRLVEHHFDLDAYLSNRVASPTSVDNRGMMLRVGAFHVDDISAHIQSI
jgi:hypothetical protein